METQRRTFGNENYSYITDTDINLAVQQGERGVADLVKKIWMHPDHPENWNVQPNRHTRSEFLVYSLPGQWHYADAKLTVKDGLLHVLLLCRDYLIPRSLDGGNDARQNQMTYIARMIQGGKGFNDLVRRIQMMFVNFWPNDVQLPEGLENL